jgi:hypothetical protein
VTKAGAAHDSILQFSNGTLEIEAERLETRGSGVNCPTPPGAEEPTKTPTPGPLTYLDWNDALASSIFRPEMAGREVFMFVNDDLVEELGGAGSVPEFVAAVEQGPPWVDSRLGLCQRAAHALDGWRERGLRYPPYVGYLGLFVLAVGVEGEFAPHAYYARLKTLLGWEAVDPGAPPSFDKMLWNAPGSAEARLLGNQATP